MPAALVEVTCFSCGTKSMKRKAEINFQQRKYSANGGIGIRPVFCSRKCGQAYSGRLTGHNITNLKAVAKSLAVREGWKYCKLKAFLKKRDLKFKFEYALADSGFIFDLAVKIDNRKLLIEFDGKYHTEPQQIKVDKKKNKAAKDLGWELIRISTDDKKVISPSVIKNIVVAS